VKEPKINVYRCQYGCNTVTVDVDEGVTPFMIKCRAKSRPDRPLRPELTGPNGECVGTAQSNMYPRGPRPSWIGEPTHEWYLPTIKEAKKLNRKYPGMLEHVEQGGLNLRARTDREPVYHEERP
jgi:hypothetical protein